MINLMVEVKIGKSQKTPTGTDRRDFVVGPVEVGPRDEMEALAFIAIAAVMLVVAFWVAGLIGR